MILWPRMRTGRAWLLFFHTFFLIHFHAILNDLFELFCILTIFYILLIKKKTIFYILWILITPLLLNETYGSAWWYIHLFMVPTPNHCLKRQTNHGPDFWSQWVISQLALYTHKSWRHNSKHAFLRRQIQISISFSHLWMLLSCIVLPNGGVRYRNVLSFCYFGPYSVDCIISHMSCMAMAPLIYL